MIELVVDGESHKVQRTFLAPSKVELNCNCGLKWKSRSVKMAQSKLVRLHLKLR